MIQSVWRLRTQDAINGARVCEQLVAMTLDSPYEDRVIWQRDPRHMGYVVEIFTEGPPHWVETMREAIRDMMITGEVK